MQDYYRALELRPGAPLSEVKTAFRRLVRKYHPDLHPASRRPWAEERLKTVVEAYRAIKHWLEVTNHNMPTKVQKKARRVPEDPFSIKATEMFQYLLDGYGEEALRIYDEIMPGKCRTALLPPLGMKDYLDCLFLIAEEYERQEKLREAVEVYEEIYEEEKEEPRVRYFFDELVERLKRLYCQKLAKECEPQEAIKYYLRAVELGLERRELAIVFRRLAECAIQIGDSKRARCWLNKALELRPNLSGAERLSAQIETARAR